MQGALTERFRARLDRWLPERQILYRSGGEVTFIRLTRPVQLALGLVLLGACGWVAYASLNLIRLDDVLAAKDRRIDEIAVAYRNLGAELESAEQRFGRITHELEAKHQQLEELVLFSQRLERELRRVTLELRATEAERDKLARSERRLEERLTSLGERLEGSTSGGSDASGAEGPSSAGDDGSRLAPLVARVERGIDGLVAQRDAAVDHGADMQLRMAGLEARIGELEGVKTRYRDALSERDRALSRSRQMAERVDHLKARLGILRESQQELIARIQEHTETNLGDIEAMIAFTGLDVDALLERVSQADDSGLGGPLINLDEVAPGAEGVVEGQPSRFHSSVLKLEEHLHRWAGLQTALERLPMASPLDTYYLVSRFGKRRDPFSRRWAMHHGADLAGPLKSTVWSTAPGKVIFAGRNGPYGRMVEIDHGFGLKTRYGHLRTIHVKVGDVVEFHQKIGVMGNSGRSTGTHVHYEVLFNGEPQDPMKFIKAGQYVFKG